MDDILKNICAVIMDVDGVLTDGKIIIHGDGHESKAFNVKDGYGITVLRQAGIRTGIISARHCDPVTIRAKMLQIDMVFQDAYPKEEYYERILKEFGIEDNQVCFIGDDVADMGLIQRVGFGVAVGDAASEVKSVADYVTQTNGGSGAVREVAEMILKAQGKWIS